MCRHLSAWTSARGCLVLLAGALLVGGGAVSGQTPSAGTQPERPMQMTKVDEGQAGAMMAEHQKMMAAMRAADQKLQDLVATMDAAQGPGKVDAVAAVVRQLAAQRTGMSSDMMAMQNRMMAHMMQHMMAMQGRMGMQGGMGMMDRGGQAAPMPSLENCPIMKALAPGNAGGQPEKK